MMIFISTLILFFSSAHAEVFKGPLSSSQGGAGRAGMQSSEAALLNPALITSLRGPELVGYYRDGYLVDDQHRNAWGVAASENGPDTMFPGSIHYLRLRYTGRTPQPIDGELWHVAVAKNVLNNLSLGISGYRLTYKDPQKDLIQWNYSLGLLWVLREDIGVAYVLDNLAKPSSDVPVGLREQTKQGVGFFGNLGEIARVRLDVERVEKNNPKHMLAYMAGIEVYRAEFVLFRAGYKRDELSDQRLITAGVSFNGPRLKVDYSVEKALEGASGAVHGVDIRVPF